MGLSDLWQFSFYSILANLSSSYADIWAILLFWVGKKDSTFGVKNKNRKKALYLFYISGNRVSLHNMNWIPIPGLYGRVTLDILVILNV